MFGDKIRKTIFINGMSCGHCSKRVEDSLKSVNGVKSVKVSLDEKKADVVFKNDIDNDVLKKAVEEVGFEVVNVQ